MALASTSAPLWTEQLAGWMSGPHWGDQVRWLRMAGSHYEVEGLSQRQALALERRYGVLCGTSGVDQRLAARVRVVRGPSADFPERDCGGEYRLHSRYTPSGMGARGLRFAAQLRLGAPMQATFCSPDDGDDPYFDGAFENMFRILVAYALLDAGGVLLHSAGVVVQERAHILFGPSGAGKTTVSRMSHGLGLRVLSDELNCLEPTADGGVRVSQLPFAGDFGGQAPSLDRFVLGSVLRLYQSDGVRVAPMPNAAALASLYAAAPFVNADPYRGPGLLDNLGRLVERFEPRALYFTLAPVFWKEVLNYDSPAPHPTAASGPFGSLSRDR